MNKEILDQIDNIVKNIINSDDYKNYLYLKEKLSKNEKANSLIKQIKIKQKQLVKEQANNKDIKELDNEINEMLEKLNRIPLYTDYVEVEMKLNNLYQTIKEYLDNYFYKKMN